ncbi:MAG: hypothetical protein M3Z54_01415 [Gemmatimonadota bacterium]|nr:hypothetical protein [Gemmatimonadota bacterium]
MSSRNVPNSPCAEQTPEDIERWLREEIKVGSEVVIRETQGGLLQYMRGRVVRVGKAMLEVVRQRRDGSYDHTGESFNYSGRNRWHPKGQTQLVMPTPEVLAACDQCMTDTGFMPGSAWSYTTSF